MWNDSVDKLPEMRDPLDVALERMDNMFSQEWVNFRGNRMSSSEHEEYIERLHDDIKNGGGGTCVALRFIMTYIGGKIMLEDYKAGHTS